jgi:flavin reductase (DIM6/NTAB) family NADH-FMN oxidoreductase RutF
VNPPRVAECPVQMEGIVHDVRPFGKNVSANAFEVRIVKLHVEGSLLTGDASLPHIDPQKWRPLIMSFCRFFGVGSEAHSSRLAESNFMNFANRGNHAVSQIKRA